MLWRRVEAGRWFWPRRSKPTGSPTNSLSLSLSLPLDAFVDVGFVSQEKKFREVGPPRVPYGFLFNGLLRSEAERLAAERPERFVKPIPWTFIGHKTLERVRLVRWLVEEVGAQGVTFLPDQGRGVRPGSGAISPRGMDLILGKTRYYVWTSHHDFAYYESFRFREAILNGAVPLKIDARFAAENSSVPGVVASRKELAQVMVEGDYARAYKASRSYYLENDLLHKGLKKVFLGGY